MHLKPYLSRTRELCPTFKRLLPKKGMRVYDFLELLGGAIVQTSLELLEDDLTALGSHSDICMYIYISLLTVDTPRSLVI